MVEHVVASAEDDAWFQYGPLKPRGADNFFGSPFCLVVRGAAIGSGTEKAQEHDALDPGLLRGINDIPRPAYVDRTIRLAAQFAIDPGAVCHRVAAGKRLA